jgi:hypothetical protein
MDMKQGISPYQAIFNFYPVDRNENYFIYPNATFTFIRLLDVTNTGTILAPQGNIDSLNFSFCFPLSKVYI